MSEYVAVPVKLPLGQYRALAKAAAVRGVQVHTLIEERIAAAFEPVPQWDQRLIALHDLGWNDRRIAAELQCNSATVYRARKRLRLPANDLRGGLRAPKGQES